MSANISPNTISYTEVQNARACKIVRDSLRTYMSHSIASIASFQNDPAKMQQCVQNVEYVVQAAMQNLVNNGTISRFNFDRPKIMSDVVFECSDLPLDARPGDMFNSKPGTIIVSVDGNGSGFVFDPGNVAGRIEMSLHVQPTAAANYIKIDFSQAL